MRIVLLFLVYTAAFGGLAVLILGARRGGQALRRWSRRRAATRQATADRAVPWTTYSRPDPAMAAWLVGVERVTADGRVLNRSEMYRLPPDHLTSDRLDAEGRAIVWAAQCNESRVGM